MTLRIGLLGAAAIAPSALIRPAAANGDVEVTAVAARDPARARSFATKHGIARVHDTYDALVEDPDVDAVYNPLPNGLHGRWTIAAVEAGKHVLCEKPFTANATEARAVADTARAADRVVMEAFHWRYHPMASRIVEIVSSGELGEITEVASSICFPLVRPGDIRYSLALAGGALMDAGCYAIHMQRHALGGEPEVVDGRAVLTKQGVDRAFTGSMRFPNGATGRIACSMLSRRLLSLRLVVTGTEGSLKVANPLQPKLLGAITVDTRDGKRREKPWPGSTYDHQLTAFVAAVQDGSPFPTDLEDAVANMDVIDAYYRAAGLEPGADAVIGGDEVRRTALSFPGTEERETWGHPTFRYGDKMFMGMDTAGTAGSVKASKEDQAALIESDPETFSKAAYVGHHGWVAVVFATVDPDEMRELIEEAWRMTAPKRVVKAYDLEREGG